jgi:hypothetical protein
VAEPCRSESARSTAKTTKSSVAGAIERHSSLCKARAARLSIARPRRAASSACSSIASTARASSGSTSAGSPPMLSRLWLLTPPDSVRVATADRPHAQATGGASGPIATIVGMDDADLIALRIPVALRGRAREILAITARSCTEHLDDEYAHLCRQLVARLARKRPSPLLRGDTRIWAAGAIYAVGQVNFLFDPRSLSSRMRRCRREISEQQLVRRRAC